MPMEWGPGLGVVNSGLDDVRLSSRNQYPYLWAVFQKNDSHGQGFFAIFFPKFSMLRPPPKQKNHKLLPSFLLISHDLAS